MKTTAPFEVRIIYGAGRPRESLYAGPDEGAARSVYEDRVREIARGGEATRNDNVLIFKGGELRSEYRRPDRDRK